MKTFPSDRRLAQAFAVLLTVEGGFIIANVWRLPPMWRLGEEGGVPTYLHTGVLLTIAALFWLMFRRYGASGTARAWTWALGALGFVYLAMDEAIEIHERTSRVVFERMGLQEDIAHYRLTPAVWELLFGPLFAVIGVVILAALYQERHRTPAALKLGLVAIGIWGLALVTEFVELTYFIDDRYKFGAAIWVEETSEMMGSTVFLAATLLAARGYLATGGRPGP